MFNPLQPTRLTAVLPGVYQVTGDVIWVGGTGAPNTFRNLWIRLNGMTFIALQTDSPIATGQGQEVSTLIQLNAGDYVELLGEQNTGANLAIAKDEASSPEFMMVRV